MPSRDGTAGRIKSHHTTAEYVRNYEAAGLAKPELSRYCQTCGRLPAWCECEKGHDRGVLVLDARPMRKEGGA